MCDQINDGAGAVGDPEEPGAQVPSAEDSVAVAEADGSWLTREVGGVEPASFFSDFGHEIATARCHRHDGNAPPR